jgi:hypothetical protein
LIDRQTNWDISWLLNSLSEHNKGIVRVETHSHALKGENQIEWRKKEKKGEREKQFRREKLS